MPPKTRQATKKEQEELANLRPKTRQATRKEQEKPTTSAPNPPAALLKPSRKSARVTPAGRKAPVRKAARVTPAGRKAPARQRQPAKPKPMRRVARTSTDGMRRYRLRSFSDSSSGSEWSSAESDSAEDDDGQVSANSTFPLLKLPFVAAKHVFEQMTLQEQIRMSTFRRSRKFLKQFPDKSFKNISRVYLDFWGDLYIKSEGRSFPVTFAQAENVTKHRVSSTHFSWEFNDENVNAFWNLLALHDEKLCRLQLRGEVDQDLYNALVATPRWKKLKEVRHKRGHHKSICIKAEDVSHLEEFRFGVEEMSEDTWKDILKNFHEKKSTFKINTMTSLPSEEIKAWLNGNTNPGSIVEIEAMRDCDFIRVQDIPTNPASVLVFAMNDNQICGKMCDKEAMKSQFEEFWRRIII